MATHKEAAQQYDNLEALLRMAEHKARMAVEAGRQAKAIKIGIFADSDLKAKVKSIADARGQSITALGTRVKTAVDMDVAMVKLYPDLAPPAPEPEAP